MRRSVICCRGGRGHMSCARRQSVRTLAAQALQLTFAPEALHKAGALRTQSPLPRRIPLSRPPDEPLLPQVPGPRSCGAIRPGQEDPNAPICVVQYALHGSGRDHRTELRTRTPGPRPRHSDHAHRLESAGWLHCPRGEFPQTSTTPVAAPDFICASPRLS